MVTTGNSGGDETRPVLVDKARSATQVPRYPGDQIYPSESLYPTKRAATPPR